MKNQDDVVRTSTGELRMNCMFCPQRTDRSPDKGKHLYINIKKNLYFCHRCEAKGKAEQLKAWIHDIQQQRDHHDIISEAKKKHQIIKHERTYVNLDLVGNPVTEGTPSWLYLTKERGLSIEDIRYYDLRSGTKNMRGRILVPVFDREGYCIYYSARTYTNQKPKYKNPKIDKKNVIFHLHGVQTDYAIVCEGVFSAIHAGRSAVAILGKYISKPQYHQLAKRFRKIYLALDGDEYHKDKARPPDKKKIPPMLNTLRKLGCEAGVVPMPKDKDPEDIGQKTFLKLVQETPTSSARTLGSAVPSQRKFYS